MAVTKMSFNITYKTTKIEGSCISDSKADGAHYSAVWADLARAWTSSSGTKNAIEFHDFIANFVTIGGKQSPLILHI